MQYISQIILCLLVAAAVPMALISNPIKIGKRLLNIKLWQRLLPVELLIIYGAVYYLITRDASGIFATLIGVIGLLIVVGMRKKNANDNINDNVNDNANENPNL